MDDIADILTSTRRIAVVGASNKPERAGNYVFEFLVARGFDVTGVNPGLAGQSLHGRPVVASLDDAAPLDMVDVFRASDQVGPVVDDAIRLGARTIWMQLGVIDEAAAERARAAGLRVVMDRCPLQDGAASDCRPLFSTAHSFALEAKLTAGHMRAATTTPWGT